MAVAETNSTSNGGKVVGALACQRDSYLRTLETEVVSCEKRPLPTAAKGNASKKKSKDSHDGNGNNPEIWLIEFADSIIFPEGGGQPSDHGTITSLSDSSAESIRIEFAERVGLRCVLHSPRPLAPGTKVRQEVDFPRRWDHMQQHTGQHLLSAIMDTTCENLNTVGWGMGRSGAMNYVDVPRKPSEAELQAIQARCNEVIRESLPVSVETPDDAAVHKMPDDYDQSRGVVRVIRIGDIDRNTCCGTHLCKTSHISLLLIHHGEQVHGKAHRLYFSAGDRAISLATTSIGAMGSISRLLSCRSAPDEVVQSVKSIQGSAAELKKREKKLLTQIAQFEADAARARLQIGRSAWVHHADGGADFVKSVSVNVRDAVTAAESAGAVVVVATGEEKMGGGQVVILGQKAGVEALVPKVKDVVGANLKGGGAGDKWQGKVSVWDKGILEALRELVEGFGGLAEPSEDK